ncbi:hypothetical protein AC579_1386 [Pseudocercospora musae]|uniref:Uncharacterized protein n=1 Tax=Pseudocercospora musae TaxID=113226 RepID=A0A139H7E7_9PEZI|nr:hypothetical protein AC579_1386 [Pseudocercospora musae]
MTFENLENGTQEEVASSLGDVVKQAFSVTEDGVNLPGRLRALGYPEPRLDTRDVREVGKVANYWRIARHLAICARRFRSCFTRAEWTPLPRYRPSTTSEIQPRRYVHAEIQLLVHYELISPALMPRAIGVSKQACFLCDSFIRAHGQFAVTGAHRQIFPQWTVPDLEEYSAQTIQRFRRALSQLLVEVEQEKANSQKKRSWLPPPMQSAINLNVVQFSSPSNSTLQQPEGPFNEDNGIATSSKRSTSVSTLRANKPEINCPRYNTTDSDPAVTSTPLACEPQSRTEPDQAVAELPIEIALEGTIQNQSDWIHLIATFSSLPDQFQSTPPRKRYTIPKISLEPAPKDQGLRKIKLSDIPEQEELVLEIGMEENLDKFLFLLAGPKGQEICVLPNKVSARSNPDFEIHWKAADWSIDIAGFRLASMASMYCPGTRQQGSPLFEQGSSRKDCPGSDSNGLVIPKAKRSSQVQDGFSARSRNFTRSVARQQYNLVHIPDRLDSAAPGRARRAQNPLDLTCLPQHLRVRAHGHLSDSMDDLAPDY